ncbi:MAG: hypothetical protein Devi2KO_29540 [Devosia indica]
MLWVSAAAGRAADRPSVVTHPAMVRRLLRLSPAVMVLLLDMRLSTACWGEDTVPAGERYPPVLDRPHKPGH